MKKKVRLKNKLRLVVILVVVSLAGFLAAMVYNKWQTSSTQDSSSESANMAANINGAWAKRCDKPKEGAAAQKSYCEAFQILSITKTKQKFLEFAVGYRGNPVSANAVIVLPLGIKVDAGGLMQIDYDKGGEKFTVATCLPVGCVARFKIKSEFLAKMTTGKNMYISFADAQGKIMKIELPLQGFAQTLASLNAFPG